MDTNKQYKLNWDHFMTIFEPFYITDKRKKVFEMLEASNKKILNAVNTKVENVVVEKVVKLVEGVNEKINEISSETISPSSLSEADAIANEEIVVVSSSYVTILCKYLLDVCFYMSDVNHICLAMGIFICAFVFYKIFVIHSKRLFDPNYSDSESTLDVEDKSKIQDFEHPIQLTNCDSNRQVTSDPQHNNSLATSQYSESLTESAYTPISSPQPRFGRRRQRAVTDSKRFTAAMKMLVERTSDSISEQDGYACSCSTGIYFNDQDPKKNSVYTGSDNTDQITTEQTNEITCRNDDSCFTCECDRHKSSLPEIVLEEINASSEIETNNISQLEEDHQEILMSSTVPIIQNESTRELQSNLISYCSDYEVEKDNSPETESHENPHDDDDHVHIRTSSPLPNTDELPIQQLPYSDTHDNDQIFKYNDSSSPHVNNIEYTTIRDGGVNVIDQIEMNICDDKEENASIYNLDKESDNAFPDISNVNQKIITNSDEFTSNASQSDTSMFKDIKLALADNCNTQNEKSHILSRISNLLFNQFTMSDSTETETSTSSDIPNTSRNEDNKVKDINELVHPQKSSNLYNFSTSHLLKQLPPLNEMKFVDNTSTGIKYDGSFTSLGIELPIISEILSTDNEKLACSPDIKPTNYPSDLKTHSTYNLNSEANVSISEDNKTSRHEPNSNTIPGAFLKMPGQIIGDNNQQEIRKFLPTLDNGIQIYKYPVTELIDDDLPDFYKNVHTSESTENRHSNSTDASELEQLSTRLHSRMEEFTQWGREFGFNSPRMSTTTTLYDVTVAADDDGAATEFDISEFDDSITSDDDHVNDYDICVGKDNENMYGDHQFPIEETSVFGDIVTRVVGQVKELAEEIPPILTDTFQESIKITNDTDSYDNVIENCSKYSCSDENNESCRGHIEETSTLGDMMTRVVGNVKELAEEIPPILTDKFQESIKRTNNSHSHDIMIGNCSKCSCSDDNNECCRGCTTNSARTCDCSACNLSSDRDSRETSQDCSEVSKISSKSSNLNNSKFSNQAINSVSELIQRDILGINYSRVSNNSPIQSLNYTISSHSPVFDNVSNYTFSQDSYCVPCKSSSCTSNQSLNKTSTGTSSLKSSNYSNQSANPISAVDSKSTSSVISSASNQNSDPALNNASTCNISLDSDYASNHTPYEATSPPISLSCTSNQPFICVPNNSENILNDDHHQTSLHSLSESQSNPNTSYYLARNMNINGSIHSRENEDCDYDDNTSKCMTQQLSSETSSHNISTKDNSHTSKIQSENRN